MEMKERMSNMGWYISNDGYQLLTEGSAAITNTNNVNAKALDIDIREFGEPVLGSLQKQNRTNKIILQIQKIRNIAAPKSKEESQFAPRMLKLILTDGHTTCPAIEVSNISFLSRSHTPPGSKLLIHDAAIASGCILLEPKCCELLGGRVPMLCEKWEFAKNISHNIRSVGCDGPPPWVNFGEKITTPSTNEPFKALADKITKETNEFDLHRQDAISTATTGAIKKVFGGGVKQPAAFNNSIKQSKPYSQEFNKSRHLRNNKGKDAVEKIDKLQKPQENVSLFAFLEDKLPVNQINDKHSYNKYPERESMNQIMYSNNFSFEHGSKSLKDKSYRGKPSNGSSVGSEPSSKMFDTPSSFVAKDARNHTNPQINKTAINDLSKNMTKLSFDTQFAARSLKQHLNIYPNKNANNDSSSTSAYNWKIGDLCMAKYWEDGKYYNAVVSNLTPSTCVVSFNGYGNVEEVLKADCIPLGVDDDLSSSIQNGSYKKNNKGTREYHSNRRSYTNKPVNSANHYYKS